MDIMASRIRASFRPNSNHGFTAVTTYDGPSNPVYVICTKAAAFLEKGGSMELPQGLTSDALSSFSWMSGYYDQEFSVTGRQAEEIADIGKQLLELSTGGEITLNQEQVSAIEHLIEAVDE